MAAGIWNESNGGTEERVDGGVKGNTNVDSHGVMRAIAQPSVSRPRRIVTAGTGTGVS